MQEWQTIVVALWAALTVFVLWLGLAKTVLGRRERAWQARLLSQADQRQFEWVPPPS